MIAVPNWEVAQEQLVAAINHELHHMARQQNVGYGNTLGGALLSEGLATYYGTLRSGWQAPWSETEVKESVAKKALTEWGNTDYNRKEWFFDGPLGKWVVYSLGVKLAEELYAGGFDLKDSILITLDWARAAFERVVD
jgi:uncharacterized protein YjaZ